MKIREHTPISCKILLRSSAMHLSPIFTGFGILEKKRIVNVSLQKDEHYFPNAPQRLRVIVGGKMKILFDCRDAKSLHEEDLNWADLYFKRSYHADHRSNSKVRPLGFIYPVYGPEDYSMRFLKYNFQYGFKHPKSYRMVINNIIGSVASLATVLNREAGRGVADYVQFECQPIYQDNPLILFQFRLWDPDAKESLEQEPKVERENINCMRLACLRALKKEFGALFVGGVQPNRYAIKTCPDLIIESDIAKKAAYLGKFRQSSIGIATMGLWESNGFKLGEYVAGAKAIVCEHPRFMVPGDFADGRNYFGFNSPEVCVEKVAQLIDNPELRFDMMEKNLRYYHMYLRPDCLVWNAIKESMGLS